MGQKFSRAIYNYGRVSETNWLVPCVATNFDAGEEKWLVIYGLVVFAAIDCFPSLEHSLCSLPISAIPH